RGRRTCRLERQPPSVCPRDERRRRLGFWLMDDENRLTTELLVDDADAIERGERKRAARAADAQADDLRVRLQPIVEAHDVRGRGFVERVAGAQLRVLRWNPLRISGERLEDERGGMQPAPFLPAREEERIQCEVLARERTGDRLEARLLPAAAGLTVFEDF